MLALLKTISAESKERPLSDVEKAGLVQFFGITTELGWKTLGDFLRSQLVDIPMSPLPVIRRAFANELVDDAQTWVDAVERRNLMSHAYEKSAFDALVVEAGERFVPMFEALVVRLSTERPT